MIVSFAVINDRRRNLSLVGLIVALASLSSSSALAQGVNSPALTVSGWPLLPLPASAPPTWLGSDPVLGRLICPPLTRLDLKMEASEDLIFGAVEQKGKQWSVAIRSGIYWWNGKPVTGKDVAAYIRANLKKIVAERSLGSWSVPDFSIQETAHGINIEWDGEPEFGPYVFNGFPFWRATPAGASRTGLAYECAGIYIPEISPNGIRLRPNQPYHLAKQELWFPSQPVDSVEADINFTLSRSTPVDVKARPPDRPAACRIPVDIPWISAISWNPSRKLTSSADFRKTLTMLTPRGALLRNGAAYMGSLPSGPIPRIHPGYNKAEKVIPFSLSDGGARLDKLGYTRREEDSPRKKDGTLLTLAFGAVSLQPTLAEKVVVDALIAVGIDVTVKRGGNFKASSLDGIITGMYVPWPELNLIGAFHSSSKQAPFGWTADSGALDRSLEKYAQSLTMKKPDFKLLQVVHKHLAELEHLTVMLQHRSCLGLNGTLAKRNESLLKTFDVKDPDWFRKIIL